MISLIYRILKDRFFILLYGDPVHQQKFRYIDGEKKISGEGMMSYGPFHLQSNVFRYSMKLELLMPF
jgi:hypothetical protein